MKPNDDAQPVNVSIPAAQHGSKDYNGSFLRRIFHGVDFPVVVRRVIGIISSDINRVSK